MPKVQPFAPRPRKRGPTAVKKQQIVFRTTPEEFDLIDAAAEKLGLNKSDWLREAIFEKLTKQK
jgi:uncharacterized protein (DUF1778 family)